MAKHDFMTHGPTKSYHLQVLPWPDEINQNLDLYDLLITRAIIGGNLAEYTKRDL